MARKLKNVFRYVIVSALLTTTIASPFDSAWDTYTENCNNIGNNFQTEVCVDNSGFYYTLLNEGSANYTSMEGNGLQERNALLNFLQSNKCPLSFASNLNNCGNDCCFCDLEFPLPYHPISSGLIVPTGLTCAASFDSISKLPQQRHQDWHPLTTNIVHECKLHREDRNPITARLPFLCLFRDNLEQLLQSYNNPRALNVDDYYKQRDRHQKRFQLSWRNSSAVISKSSTLTPPNTRTPKEKTEGQDDDPEADSSFTAAPFSESTTESNEMVNEIKFNLYTDTEKDVDTVTVESIPDSNLTMSFSGIL